MAEIIEYKCPNCDGIITFDSQSQKMKCQYCGTELSVEAIQSYNQALITIELATTQRKRMGYT